MGDKSEKTRSTDHQQEPETSTVVCKWKEWKRRIDRKEYQESNDKKGETGRERQEGRDRKGETGNEWQENAENER